MNCSSHRLKFAACMLRLNPVLASHTSSISFSSASYAPDNGQLIVTMFGLMGLRKLS